MEDKIIKIIEELTDIKNLKENKDIDLIENEILDSLAFIEFIYKLEEEFNIEIQPTEVESSTWRKIDSIVKMVKAYKNI